MNDSAIGARLETIRHDWKYTPDEVAERIGCTVRNYRDMELNKRNLTMSRINYLQNVYPDLNLHWLLTGQGDRYQNY